MMEKLNILIADDDKVFLNSLMHHLSKFDHHIITAADGKKAVSLFDEYLPDLVLTDLRMPRVDGLDVIKHIRSYSNDIPVIVVSGQGNMNDAIEALKYGAWDYLIKPVENLDILSHTISKAREHIRLVKENKDYQDNLEQKVDDRTTKLRESEQKFRTLTETLPSAIFLYHNDRFIYVNKAAERITGYTFFELLRLNFWDIVHPDFQEKVRSIGRERQKYDIGIKQYDIKIVTRAGEEKWLSMTTSNINYKGKPAGIASGEDITGRKIMENNIRLNQRNLDIRKKIAQSFVTSPEREVFHNVLQIVLESFSSTYGFFGYISGGDLVIPTMTGDIWEKCNIPGKTNRFPREQWKGLWGESLKTRKSLIKNDALQVPEGHIKLKNSMAAVILVKGELLGQIVLADKEGGYTDNDLNSIMELCEFISPLLVATLRQNEYKDNLIKAKEKAEESDRLKTAFLNNVSHEIRTPVNGIMGFSELLRDEKMTEEQQQEYIQRIRISGQRMVETIDSIVALSRIESLEEEINTSKVNINQMLDAIHADIKRNGLNKPVYFKITKPLQDEQAIVHTDKDKLEQVLLKLVKNAFKFTSKGEVELGYKKLERHFELFVKDTGIGIPPEKQESIFNSFVQADNSNTRTYQGAGLGLSISKAYAAMLGGTLRLESREGKGTTFYFKLPAAGEKK